MDRVHGVMFALVVATAVGLGPGKAVAEESESESKRTAEVDEKSAADADTKTDGESTDKSSGDPEKTAADDSEKTPPDSAEEKAADESGNTPGGDAEKASSGDSKKQRAGGSEETSAGGSEGESAGETDTAGDSGESATGWRSVYVGAGTGFLLGIDTYVAPHQRIGGDVSIWRAPLFGGCDPSCFRRAEFRLHWTLATGNEHVNGGVMAGIAGGRVRDRESARQTRSGVFVGPLLGLRGTYTPSAGFGIGGNVAMTPSYFSGNRRRATPEPSETRGFRVGLSAALVLEFGHPREP